jgi:steroid delta-isomerase-like uncharacterized protein
MMTTTDLLDELYARWRNQDIDGLCDLFTEDCVYQDMAMRVIVNGRTGIREFAAGVYGAMPDFNVSFRSRFATEWFGAGEWTISATWNGVYEGIDGSGRAVRFEGVSYYEFRDGKIARNVDCWDPTVLMEQLGVRAARLESLSPGADA